MQNSNNERQNRSGNALVFYLMEQLYDMKPKIDVENKNQRYGNLYGFPKETDRDSTES